MKYILTTTFLIIAFLVPAHIAHALPLGIGSCETADVTQSAVSGATSKIKNFVGGGLLGGGRVPTEPVALVAKECVGDPLVFALKQLVISSLTQSIIDWINGGFEGAPLFVTNLRFYLEDVANNVAIDFINGGELGGVCSPFRTDVRRALAIQHQQSFRENFRIEIECSLDSVAGGNAAAIIDGEFSDAGGWPAWHALHADAANNPYGALAKTSQELEKRKIENVKLEKASLEQSDGYFGNRKCLRHVTPSTTISDEGGEVTRTEDSRCVEWENQTPGISVAATVNDLLGSGLRQLELADEMNEIINALLAQVSQKALTGRSGLRGLSSRSSSASRNFTDSSGVTQTGSYLEALVGETSASSIGGALDILLANIQSAIDLEQTYINNVDTALGSLETHTNQTFLCYAELGADTSLATNITNQKNFYIGQRGVAEATIIALEEVRDDAARAQNVTQLNRAADAYDAILASGVIHSVPEIQAIIDLAEGLETVAADAALQEQCNNTN